MPSFDIGGLVVGSDVKSARLLLKSSGVFCGKPFMDAVFHVLDCKIEWKEEAIEGTFFEISEPLCLAIVTGPVNALLRGERTALNTLSRCSGVATASRQACAIASSYQLERTCRWNTKDDTWLSDCRKVWFARWWCCDTSSRLVSNDNAQG